MATLNTLQEKEQSNPPSCMLCWTALRRRPIIAPTAKTVREAGVHAPRDAMSRKNPSGQSSTLASTVTPVLGRLSLLELATSVNYVFSTMTYARDATKRTNMMKRAIQRLTGMGQTLSIKSPDSNSFSNLDQVWSVRTCSYIDFLCFIEYSDQTVRIKT